MSLAHAVSAAAAALVLALPSQAAQPHMEAALASLQSARAELQKASEDKGGYRAKALQSVDRAIKDVKAGIDWDKKHLSPAERAKK